MVNRLKSAFFLTCCLYACQGPAGKPALDRNPATVQDSVQTGKPDGVAVEPPVLTQQETLPPALVQELNRHYQGWQLPQFSDSYRELLGLKHKNLIWVKGDFDNNRQEDFAAQFRLRDSVLVVAFLQQNQRDTFRKFELARSPLFKQDDLPAGSLFYLSFIPKNDSVYNYLQERKVRLPSDAVSVGMEYGISTYFFQAGKWQQLETGD